MHVDNFVTRAQGKSNDGSAIFRAATAVQLASAMNMARPGDRIVLADGEWKDVIIAFDAEGALGKPVTLCAETPGKARLTGCSRLSLEKPHLVVEGLLFANGYPADRMPVITFNSDYGRVTETSIVDYNPTDSTTGYYWVFFKGSHNRLDRSLFKGKSNDMPLIGNDFAGAKHNRVDRCHFRDIPYIPDRNGREIFRIWGYGRNDEPDDDGAYFTIESNLFERADGEGMEIISLKSNHNKVCNNTIIESKGGIVARSGNTNTIEGNMIIGNRAPVTRGIRVSGHGLRVADNYVEGVESGALIIHVGEHVFGDDGEPDYLWNGFKPIRREEATRGYVVRYGQVKDSLFEGNTFVDNGGVDVDIGAFFYKRAQQAVNC